MSKLEKIKKTGNGIKNEVNKKMVTYILAGFGLVAGLAWNEAIKNSIEYLFPMTKNTLLAKFLYALIITVVLGVISYYLSKITAEKEKSDKEKNLSD